MIGTADSDVVLGGPKNCSTFFVNVIGFQVVIAGNLASASVNDSLLIAHLGQGNLSRGIDIGLGAAGSVVKVC